MRLRLQSSSTISRTNPLEVPDYEPAFTQVTQWKAGSNLLNHGLQGQILSVNNDKPDSPFLADPFLDSVAELLFLNLPWTGKLRRLVVLRAVELESHSARVVSIQLHSLVCEWIHKKARCGVVLELVRVDDERKVFLHQTFAFEFGSTQSLFHPGQFGHAFLVDWVSDSKDEWTEVVLASSPQPTMLNEHIDCAPNRLWRPVSELPQLLARILPVREPELRQRLKHAIYHNCLRLDKAILNKLSRNCDVSSSPLLSGRGMVTDMGLEATMCSPLCAMRTA